MKTLLPKISVVILAYNEEVLLPGCLESVFNQEFDKRLYEVIVVDNASTDKTGQIAKSKGARVIKENKKGYALALNAGIKASQGEIIAITDADCRVPRDWLKKIANHFDQDPKVAAVGGVYSFFDGDSFYTKLISFFVKNFNLFLCGMNMAFKKKALEKASGFDPKINLAADAFVTFKIRCYGKVKIDRSSIVKTSARRFKKGAFKNISRYLLNFFYLIFFKRPLISDFPDIREKLC